MNCTRYTRKFYQVPPASGSSTLTPQAGHPNFDAIFAMDYMPNNTRPDTPEYFPQNKDRIGYVFHDNSPLRTTCDLYLINNDGSSTLIAEMYSGWQNETKKFDVNGDGKADTVSDIGYVCKEGYVLHAELAKNEKENNNNLNSKIEHADTAFNMEEIASFIQAKYGEDNDYGFYGLVGYWTSEMHNNPTKLFYHDINQDGIPDFGIHHRKRDIDFLIRPLKDY